MALSSEQLTTWRTTPTSVGVYCFLHRPATVFAARVNQQFFSRPAIALTYDTVTTGAYTDIREDMTLLLGSAAGLDDYGRVRVRKDDIVGAVATSTLIFIQRSSRGSLDGEINPSDNAYITVLDLHQIWAVPPYIEPVTGLVFKDTSRLLIGDWQQRPKANAGADLLVVLPSVGSTYEYTYGEIASFGTHPDAGDLTYSWVFPDEQTATDATGTVEFEADTVGYVYLTVTDARGNSSQSKCFIAIVSEDHEDLITQFQITQHTHNRQGQQLQIRFNQSIPYNTYPDGTEVLIAQRERYGDTVTNLASSMVFAGWIGQENWSGQASARGFLSVTNIQCTDVAGRAVTLPGFPLLVERESSPEHAGQMKGANVDRYVFHILDEHSNIMRRVDFTWSGTGEDYAFTTLGSDGSSLYDQADQRTQAIAHKLTCDRRGRLWMKPDPLLQQSSSRTSTVIVPIEERDWTSYQITYTRAPRIHWNWGEAIVSSATDAADTDEIQTVFCVAPGNAPGMGIASQTSGQQLVKASTPQTELNIREGQRYAARMNAIYGNIDVLLSRMGDAGIDPALMQWVRFEITSNTSGVRGRTIVNTTRFLPVEVRYDYDHRAGTRKTRLALEKEVNGFAAETYVPPDDPGIVIVPPPIYPPPPVVPPPVTEAPHLLSGGASIIAAFGTDNYVYITEDFTSATPTWVRYALSLTGNLVDFAVDPFSPLYIGTGTTVNGIIVTDSATDCVVFISDIFGVTGSPRQLTVIKSSLLSNTSTGTRGRRVETTFGMNGAAVIVSNYQNQSGSTGTWYAYSLNFNGASPSWSTEAQVTSHYETVTGNGVGGIWLSPRNPGTGIISAYTATGAAGSAEAAFYRLSNLFSSVSQITAPSGFDPNDIASWVHVPYHDNPDESIAYFHAPVYPALEGIKRKNADGSISDVTPAISGEGLYFGSLHRRPLATSPLNRQRAATFATNSGGTVRSGIFVSDDAGDSWTKITPDATTPYRSVFLAGDDQDVIYLIGNSGAIGVTDDFGATSIEDRSGNIGLDFGSVGTFVNIVGGG